MGDRGSFARADFLHGRVEVFERTGQIRDQPGLLAHFDDHGAVARADHLVEKLGDRVAMAFDESRLAAADIGDQGDRERQVRFLPEIADFARLAVIGQMEIFGLEISRRARRRDR